MLYFAEELAALECIITICPTSTGLFSQDIPLSSSHNDFNFWYGQIMWTRSKNADIFAAVNQVGELAKQIDHESEEFMKECVVVRNF